MAKIKLVTVIVCVIITFSVAAPISEDEPAKILTSKNENDGQGNYEFSFETSNGISRSETGTLVNVGEPNEHLEVQGVYSYTDPEGNLVVFNYSADENGYHIYLPPPIISTAFGSPVSPHLVASLLGG